MPRKERLCGFNFGNWLSQSSLKSPHIDKFYGEKDMALLSEWGFNFVRLPVDYMFFENDDNPGIYDEKKLAYVDRAVSWGEKYDVHVNLDMHELPGYGISQVASDQMYKPLLWDNEELLKRSENIWRMFAKRYCSKGEFLSFNLINEPIAEMSLYKRFVERMINAIREIDVDRRIFVDGCDVSRTPVQNLKHENVWQSFHMYEPMWVTHYGASWFPAGYIYESGCYIYDEPALYPGVPPRMEKYLDRLPSDRHLRWLHPRDQALIRHLKDFFSRYAGKKIDKKWLEDWMMPWFDFAKKSNTPIHCGELGVYALRIERKSQLNWYRDVLDVLKKHNVGWALWNFRGPFGPVNDGRPDFPKEKLAGEDYFDPELLKILQDAL
ncbi:cellulase family glycosylhydrolase [Candidatus Bathyarchaeota archaeon]|nr:cellulase family glycosylhydrolase [Candidatus Bathyarchaeota archaeon]